MIFSLFSSSAAMAAKGRVTCLIGLLVLSSIPQPGMGSSKFLQEHSIDKKAFKQDIENAMGSMLGCGGEADPEKAVSVKNVLTPMWRTLPKTSSRVDRRTLRYLVHRHFMQTSSLMVRGFEPTRLTNDSHWGAADILSQMVPAYVESVLESQHNTMYGFNLKDAVDMVIMLDQLIFDSESAVLEGVYKTLKKSTKQSVSHDEVTQLFESYIVNWMIEASPEDHAMLNQNKSLAAELLPHYHDLMKFTAGSVK